MSISKINKKPHLGKQTSSRKLGRRARRRRELLRRVKGNLMHDLSTRWPKLPASNDSAEIRLLVRVALLLSDRVPRSVSDIGCILRTRESAVRCALAILKRTRFGKGLLKAASCGWEDPSGAAHHMDQWLLKHFATDGNEGPVTDFQPESDFRHVVDALSARLAKFVVGVAVQAINPPLADACATLIVKTQTDSDRAVVRDVWVRLFCLDVIKRSGYPIGFGSVKFLYQSQETIDREFAGDWGRWYL